MPGLYIPLPHDKWTVSQLLLYKSSPAERSLFWYNHQIKHLHEPQLPFTPKQQKQTHVWFSSRPSLIFTVGW